MSRKTPQQTSRIRALSLLSGLLSMGLCVPALAQSVPFPTYVAGPQPDGSYVVSDGTIITPAGTQVNLGIRVRAKAVALNPTGNHTAAVLTLGTSAANGNGAVEVFNTQTGAVLQSYSALGNKDSSGSHVGITYTPDGKYLLFSQDSSYVAIANSQCGGLALRLRPRQCSARRQPLQNRRHTFCEYAEQRHLLSQQPSGNRWQLRSPLRLYRRD